MKDWRIIKKIEGLDLSKKCFNFDELPQSDKHEEQIEFFTNKIESLGHEIFDVKGHQFMTSNGVYTIVHKSEVQYGE